MDKLSLGVLGIAVMHLFNAVAPEARQKLVDRIGRSPWKIAFTLVNLAGLYLIVNGWAATTPASIYAAPAWARPVASALALAGFILFFAPYLPNNFRRLLRHPQLSGLLLWAVGHLLANGDTRSLILFGGLGTWSVLQIIATNRRDGPWRKPAPAPRWGDVVLVVAGAAAGLVLAWLHLRWFGVAVISFPA